MTNFWKKYKNKPLLALAPMAGITDSAFRLLCKKFGVDLIYSEMISSEGIVYGKSQDYWDWEKKEWGKLNKSLKLAKFSQKEQPIILQIFGKKPEIMAQAAEILVKKFKPAGIDINMGCPAKKVIKSEHGAALIKKPDLACEIVKAVKKAVGKKVLVSVKTRLGWEDKKDILKFAPKLEKAGLDFLCLHGRTYQQGFFSQVDYQLIKKVKAKLKVPVIANGGIKTPEQAKEVLEVTQADGLAIGMGSWGQPWIFQQIKDYLNKGEYQKLSWPEIKRVILEHAKLAFKIKGDHGIIEMRKHLCWYIRGQKNASQLRQQLVRVESVREIASFLKI